MIEADEKNLEGQAGDGMVKISKEETGKRIRRLLAECGITVRDVQEELELDSPQSVYKWLKGKALPSLDNLLVLGCMLDLPVDISVKLRPCSDAGDKSAEGDSQYVRFEIRQRKPGDR